MSDFDKYIGLTLDELADLLEKEGKRVRAVSVDGFPCIVTRDYRKERLNVNLKKGLVISVNGWG
jgi:hypothetical protein